MYIIQTDHEIFKNIILGEGKSHEESNSKNSLITTIRTYIICINVIIALYRNDRIIIRTNQKQKFTIDSPFL